jgi:hypothetical protein
VKEPSCRGRPKDAFDYKYKGGWEVVAWSGEFGAEGCP